ncbi:UbiA family prenyltransferase [Dongia sedimenti]|uniref:UbiA family prenyltransferase n=1 Tax=Dongia sedimenti TaxID=3064282 RepID=A0ABU0YT83_9PROT|nr:UbiA family prenyltransferase [Rhodospirillaceae bacterium R-7]
MLNLCNANAMNLQERGSGFPGSARLIHSIIRALRLHQWSKNALIFVPLVLGNKLTDAAAWTAAVIGLIALGFAASATYVVNDLRDTADDRRHRSKRHRPLASSALSGRAGILIASVCFILGFSLAAMIGTEAVTLLALYVALSLSYSFCWKRIPILDVLVLAALLSLRLVVGVLLTDVRLSEWLLIFSMFVFLSLSLAKRHTEILSAAAAGVAELPGRGYRPADAPFVLAVGTATAVSSILVMILYLIEDAYPRDFYERPALLWLIPGLLFLFLGRIWLKCTRGELDDDPVIFALKDRVCLLLGVLTCLALAAALRFAPA